MKPRNEAFGSAVRMLAASVSYCDRWASSVMTMMSSRSDRTGMSAPFSGGMNLWMRVKT